MIVLKTNEKWLHILFSRHISATFIVNLIFVLTYIYGKEISSLT